MEDFSRQAKKIMNDFARITGLDPPESFPRRYLWTDAFAVCNYLGFYQETGDRSFLDLTLKLIDQVHHILGRHRPDDSRSGWISGLEEAEGEKSPTKGGLRIGKQLNERGIGEPMDNRLEWERDGQYFHYLTKWMQALDRTSRVSGDPVYHRWAVELAKSAYKSFTYTLEPGEKRHMYWKMSIDLSRPLVESMGQHDPLDGWITYAQLNTTTKLLGAGSDDLYLDLEIRGFSDMCAGRRWATEDPLGLGGLMTNAYKTALLLMHHAPLKPQLLDVLSKESLAGLIAYGRSNSLNLSASYRLAFRELGLSIGLKAMMRLNEIFQQDAAEPPAEIKNILKASDLSQLIDNFWLSPGNQAVNTWQEHREINMVMLATSLAPEGYLSL